LETPAGVMTGFHIRHAVPDDAAYLSDCQTDGRNGPMPSACVWMVPGTERSANDTPSPLMDFWQHANEERVRRGKPELTYGEARDAFVNDGMFIDADGEIRGC
jgi:hypothetical protein